MQGAATVSPIFDHERLEVYALTIEFVAWTGDPLDGPLAQCRMSVTGQLDRASTSIPLKRSLTPIPELDQ